MKIIKRDKQRYYLVDLLGWKHSRNFLILCCLPLPLVYHYGNWYGSQTVFTSPFLARSLLARLGSNFLVATNAQDSHTEVKSNRARQHHWWNICTWELKCGWNWDCADRFVHAGEIRLDFLPVLFIFWLGPCANIDPSFSLFVSPFLRPARVLCAEPREPDAQRQ